MMQFENDVVFADANPHVVAEHRYIPDATDLYAVDQPGLPFDDPQDLDKRDTCWLIISNPCPLPRAAKGGKKRAQVTWLDERLHTRLLLFLFLHL